MQAKRATYRTVDAALIIQFCQRRQAYTDNVIRIVWIGLRFKSHLYVVLHSLQPAVQEREHFTGRKSRMKWKNHYPSALWDIQGRVWDLGANFRIPHSVWLWFKPLSNKLLEYRFKRIKFDFTKTFTGNVLVETTTPVLHSFSFLCLKKAPVTLAGPLDPKPPKLHHQRVNTEYHTDKGGQQYPCSQKDTEECLTRPHIPPPPTTHTHTKHTASSSHSH